jgi:hypothetical protein
MYSNILTNTLVNQRFPTTLARMEKKDRTTTTGTRLTTDRIVIAKHPVTARLNIMSY